MIRITIGLTSIVLSVLFAAQALGLVPDRDTAILTGRKSLTEMLAVHCSVCAQRKDTLAIQSALDAAVRRNPEVLSAALRSSDGAVLAQAGDHTNSWIPSECTTSSTTHMQVPVALDDKNWAKVE